MRISDQAVEVAARAIARTRFNRHGLSDVAGTEPDVKIVTPDARAALTAALPLLTAEKDVEIGRLRREVAYFETSRDNVLASAERDRDEARTEIERWKEVHLTACQTGMRVVNERDAANAVLAKVAALIVEADADGRYYGGAKRWGQLDKEKVRAVLAEAPPVAVHERVTQYGVQVVWIDPVKAGAVKEGQPYEAKWQYFRTPERADSFASLYTVQRDAGPFNNVAAVRRAERWAEEQYGPWVSVHEGGES